jgi:hypothetical protein
MISHSGIAVNAIQNVLKAKKLEFWNDEQAHMRPDIFWKRDEVKGVTTKTLRLLDAMILFAKHTEGEHGSLYN